MGGGSFHLVDRAAREREEEALAPAATRSTATRGRAVPEPEDRVLTSTRKPAPPSSPVPSVVNGFDRLSSPSSRTGSGRLETSPS